MPPSDPVPKTPKTPKTAPAPVVAAPVAEPVKKKILVKKIKAPLTEEA
jgi:hypothetical protein